MRNEVLKQANQDQEMNTIKQHNHFLDQVRNYEEQLLKKKAETNLGLY